MKTNIFHMTLAKRFMVSLLLAFPAISLADTSYNFSPHSRIETQIAVDELNRINIRGGDIMEVIGDEGKYTLYWSSDWQNIFVKPKVGTGETFELSLIFFGGNTQDVRFTVGDTTAKTININMKDELKKFTSGCNLQTEIASLMRAMFEGDKGKYYVTDTKRLVQKTPQLEVRQIKIYKFKNLLGAVFQVKNSTKTSINLKEEDFKNLFKNTLALNLKTQTLSPKTFTTLFVVTQGEDYEN